MTKIARDLAGLSLPDLTIAKEAAKAVPERAQDFDLLWDGLEALFDL